MIDTIGKILLLSVAIAALIKYGLPFWLDLDSLTTIDRERIAILLLGIIPGIFLSYLWGVKHK
jgi:hypothetical protein